MSGRSRHRPRVWICGPRPRTGATPNFATCRFPDKVAGWPVQRKGSIPGLFGPVARAEAGAAKISRLSQLFRVERLGCNHISKLLGCKVSAKMHPISVSVAPMLALLLLSSCQGAPDSILAAGSPEQVKVVIECMVLADGGTDRCRVVAQDAPACGYSKRALEIARAGRLSPRTLDGRAQDATIRVAIPFPPCVTPPLDQPSSNR